MSRKYFILFLYILLLIKSEMKLTRTRYTNTCHCSKKQELARPISKLESVIDSVFEQIKNKANIPFHFLKYT